MHDTSIGLRPCPLCGNASPEGEVARAWNELTCCDDVPWGDDIVSFIANLNGVRNAERARATAAEAALEKAAVALKPFAEIGADVSDQWDDDQFVMYDTGEETEIELTVGDFRLASSTLAALKPTEVADD